MGANEAPPGRLLRYATRIRCWDQTGMSASAPGRKIRVNRAPVLTLRAAVVAERLGFDRGLPRSRSAAPSRAAAPR